MKKYLGLAAVLTLTLPAIWWFFGPGYYNMHDDLQVMRVVEMQMCLQDGQIPCRWAPDMAWGYGQAMFNFYSAFPYYISAIIRILTPLSVLGTVKALFAISFVTAAVGMYLLAKELWGKWAGILASVLYTYAPYHALDIYVRGALAESFSLAILPFLWLFLYRVIKSPRMSNTLGVSLSLAALLTTHNISTMIYAIPTIFWVIFWFLATKNWKSVLFVAVSGLLGVGLSSFFLLPAIYEQSLVQIKYLTQDYSDYHGHFVTLRQLFLDRSWGDGPSIFGDNEQISFQIGWPHWWLTIPSLIISLYLLYKKKFKESLLVISLVGLGFGSAFFTHSRSLFLWEKLPKIAFVQFPWRFLGLTIFFFSLAGAFIARTKSNLGALVALVLILLTIFLNKNYFVPVHYSRLVTDEQKLTGVAWELQRKAAIMDYLPKTSKIAPQDRAFETPQILEGNGLIGNYSKGSDRFSFDAEIYNESKVEIPIIYFPGWIVLIDEKITPSEIHGDYGTITINIGQGKHTVQGRFTNTPVRTLGNSLTLVSGVLLLTIAVAKKKSTNEK